MLMNQEFWNKPSPYKAQDLYEFIHTIKNCEMRTNSIFSISNLEKYCEEKSVWIFIGEVSAIILRVDNDNIIRIYYYAKNAGCLSEIISLIPTTTKNILCDIVGREPKTYKHVKELECVGFDIYAKFQRMICTDITIDKTLDLTEVELACHEDAKEILDITYEEFDPLTARIHSLDTLIDLIDKKEVFVIRKKNNIAGFAIFDSLNKKVALLDHIIVRPEYRNASLGKKLLYYKWEYMNNSEYYFLWINATEKAAIRHHEKNGFRTDGTYDYILNLKR